MTIKVPNIPCLSDLTIEQTNAMMPNVGAQLEIASANWPAEFPHKPKTIVNIAHDNNSLYIRFSVTGEGIRAVNSVDQSEVWCDSCVEFFCKLPDTTGYMNFETNCIGAMVASKRISRSEGKQVFPPEQMATIRRYSSLGKQTFEEKEGTFTWEICLGIPFEIINEGKKAVPSRILANFYKCGDKTRKPHYVSWMPISLPKPNFHCPEFFGELVLE